MPLDKEAKGMLTEEKKLLELNERLAGLDEVEHRFAAVSEETHPHIPSASITWAQLGADQSAQHANARIDLKEIDSASFIPAFQSTYHEHPISLRELSRNHQQKILFTHDFISQNELRSTALYSEVFKPMGIEYQARLVLHQDRHTLEGLGVNRSSGPFSEKDRESLARLENALKPLYRWVKSEQRFGLAQDYLSSQQSGVLVCTRSGVIVDNPLGAAEGLLTTFFHDTPTVRTLPRPVRDWLPGLAEPFESSIVEGRQLVITSRPYQDEQLQLWLQSKQTLTVKEQIAFLRQQAKNQRGAELTPQQAKVLFWLSWGNTNEQIARKMKISTSMVKKHLTQAYQRFRSAGVVEPGYSSEAETRAFFTEEARKLSAAPEYR